MSDIVLTPNSVEPGVAQRAEEVRVSLLKAKDSVEDGFLDMCDLLKEAHEKDFHVVWGHGRFGDWVEQSR
jgi:hypothetical protein